MLGTHFSYNEKLKGETNFYQNVMEIHRLLKIWIMKRLTPDVRVVICNLFFILKNIQKLFSYNL